MLPFENKCMEECQPEEELFPLEGFLRVFEFFAVLGLERSQQIVFESSWRFESHFDSFHEHCRREHIRRHRS